MNRSSKITQLLMLIPVLVIEVGLNGCGNGSGTGLDTTPPTITRVGAGISTIPSPLTPSGGSADVVVDVTDSSGVDTTSVKVNIVNQGGSPLSGYPKEMTSFNSVQNRYGDRIFLPANSNNFADNVYSITISASDIKGNAVTPPFAIGTITVPNH